MFAGMYELEARYDPRASFYGKAHVIIDDNGDHLLRSYNTIVAIVHAGANGDWAEVGGWYSATTGRHIKEFLRQHGFRAVTKSQILDDYMYDEEDERL